VWNATLVEDSVEVCGRQQRLLPAALEDDGVDRGWVRVMKSLFGMVCWWMIGLKWSVRGVSCVTSMTLISLYSRRSHALISV